MDARIDHAALGRSLHAVGYCLESTGLYEEARQWFERAVAEAAQGDLHERIDYDNLGRSQDQVGYCLARTSRYEEARQWFERAVAERENGDVHGALRPREPNLEHQLCCGLPQKARTGRPSPQI